jgi:hypothetical protein
VLARLLALNAEAPQPSGPQRSVPLASFVRRSRRKAAELAELEDV